MHVIKLVDLFKLTYVIVTWSIIYTTGISSCCTYSAYCVNANSPFYTRKKITNDFYYNNVDKTNDLIINYIFDRSRGRSAPKFRLFPICMSCSIRILQS